MNAKLGLMLTSTTELLFLLHHDDLYVQVQDFLELLKQPFTEQPGMEKWTKTSGGQIRRGIEMLSCSS